MAQRFGSDGDEATQAETTASPRFGADSDTAVAGPGRGGSTRPPGAGNHPSAFSRFVGNAASAFNPFPAMRQIATDPMGPAAGLGNAVAAPMADQAMTAIRAAKGQGEFSGMRPWERGLSATGHGAAAMIPYIGPAAANAGDQIGSGDVAGGIGSGIGLVGSVLAPGAIARGVDAIPRLGRAAGNFDTVMNSARDEPINTGPASVVANRALALKSRGGTAPKVVTDFEAATAPVRPSPRFIGPGTAPPPVTYEAGRDFASNAGRLSTTEAEAMKGDMGRQVKLLASALNDANRDAAVRAGVGDQYDAAMKEYRQASQLKTGLKTAAKVGGSVLGLGAAGNLARKYLVGEP